MEESYSGNDCLIPEDLSNMGNGTVDISAVCGDGSVDSDGHVGVSGPTIIVSSEFVGYGSDSVLISLNKTT